MSESLTDASYNRRTSSDYSGSDGIQTTCTSDDQSDDNARYMVIAHRIMYIIVLRMQQSIDKPILCEK